MNSRTIKHVQSITRDGGRTYHTCEVDGNGNPVGPPSVMTVETEPVPNGLSAIPERVSGFVSSSAASLAICALDRNRSCSLLRFGGRIRISVILIDWRQHPEREQRIRDLFTRNGIAPVYDARAAREVILHYPVPDSERIASLCSEVLACQGIADDDALEFALIQIP